MNLCLQCRRRLLTCVCASLKPFDSESRFIILMHPMEYKKEKVGTGRFSHLILKNSKIIVDVGFDDNKELQALLKDPAYETYVLYPGDNAINLSEAEVFPTKKNQFIVIDGTWPCAKKMMKLTTCLHKLPRVSFNPGRVSNFVIKHQPMPGCLSTVESIHQVLLELNRLGVEATASCHNNLLEVFEETVALQVKLAADPDRQAYRKKPLKAASERKISKKWSDRLLFFRSPN